jgi:hypothetical protein
MMALWNVETMHEKCRECRELTMSAIAHANATDAKTGISSYVEKGNVENTLHRSEVTRK